HMPMEDVVSYPPRLILRYVSHALMLYDTSPFLQNVPMDYFLNDVLFYRVGDEYIEDCRSALYQSLFPRVAHLDAVSAALEVNYWCCENASYKESDDRTASPLTTLQRCCGRCGEESVLLVSALRSVGLPARQCYTPRWAHCDDNHAWVEVYAAGRWQYLGACEPEPTLNRGWFTAAASRAVLIHAKAFYGRSENEEIADRNPVFSNLNLTATYGETTRVTVLVTSGGKPLPGITVGFELVNFSALYPVATVTTDSTGTAALRTGLGDLMLHLHDGRRFMNLKVDTRIQPHVTADFDRSALTGTPCAFELIPPAERFSDWSPVADETVFIHRRRLREAHKLRAEKEQRFLALPPVAALLKSPSGGTESLRLQLSYAHGNASELAAFLQSPMATAEEKTDLLSTLREKDFADTPASLMLETICCARPFQGRYPHEIYCESLLSPRVGNEMLLSQRPAIAAFFAAQGVTPGHPLAVWDYLTNHLQTDDTYSYPALDCDAKSALRLGICSSHALDMLFVTCCRTLGFAARLSPADGRKEYYEGGTYVSVGPGADARLTLQNAGSDPLLYFSQFTVARLEAGVFRTLNLTDKILTRALTLPVLSGYYRIITAARQIDGSVSCHLSYATVPPHGAAAVTVALPQTDLKGKCKAVPLPDHQAQTADGTDTTLFAHCTRKTSLLAFLDPGKEPTEHLLG
ncbi:MAG: transglutaminase domain-containing protein, partial [Oscillospiraceae bacterium]